MRQSYYFGHGLGVTDIGKESYAQSLTLTDLATALLPIAVVVMWRRGAVRTSLALALVACLFTAFSISNQIGFGAAERLGQSARISAINKAAADAKADQQALIKGQIKWNNNSTVSRATTRSSRKENIASTERLIAQAGAFDPSKVYAAPADIQAMSLVSLVHRWTTWTIDTEGMALFLVIGTAILIILIKPVFYGLATYFYPVETKHEASQAKREDKGKDDEPGDDAGLPLGEDARPHVEAPARHLPATVHAEAVEVAPEAAVAAGGEREIENSIDARPAIMAAFEAIQAKEAPVAVVPEPMVSVPSIGSYLIAPKKSRTIPFKAKDTRAHARLTDGHVEEFVKTLVGFETGELIPFKTSVWEKYKAFCAEKNLRPMADKVLSNALGRFGITRYRPTGGSVYMRLPADLNTKIEAVSKFFSKDAGEQATAH